MNVCFISSYPPQNEGIAKHTEQIVSDYKKQNIEVSVIAPHAANEKSLNEKGIYRKLSMNPVEVFQTVSLISTLNPDIIHVQYLIPLYGFYSFVLFSLLFFIKVTTNIKLIVTYHEVKRETNRLGILGVLYYTGISGLFDRIYIHTHEAESILLSKCHIQRAKLRVIPLGTSEFPKTSISEKIIRNKYKLYKKNIILSFGYIHIHKGIEYLLEAIALLFKTHPELTNNTQTIIVGSVRPRKGIFRFFGKVDEQYYQKLKTIVLKHSLQKSVSFESGIPDESIPTLFNMTKVIVLPYTDTEQSAVLHHAISSYVPVIASNIGGLKETLQETGVLVPPKDPKAIANELYKLLSNENQFKMLVEKYKKLSRRISLHTRNKDVINDYKMLLKKIYEN